MRATRLGLITLLLVIAETNGSFADIDECNDAISKYNSAISDVSDTVHRYASCIDDSKGSDDCSTEFSQLRNAQDDFESAVSDYTSDCGQ